MKSEAGRGSALPGSWHRVAAVAVAGHVVITIASASRHLMKR